MPVRAEMYIRDGFSYLNSAAIGLLPRSTHYILEKEISKQYLMGSVGLDFENILNNWSSLQFTIAGLINGDAEGVTLTTNTASALHIVADGVQHEMSEGQNIVIPDVEFSTNSYVWQQLAKRKKMEIRVVEYSKGNTGVEFWEDIIDENTALVSISSVQFSDGFRSEIAEIAKLVHAQNGLIVVDGIQHIGNTPFDAKKLDVDFVCAGGYKWQLGPMGTGFFYGKPELIETMESILQGWFSAEKFHFRMSHNDFREGKGARRFQQSFDPKLSGYLNSLQLVVKWGPENIFKHVNNLLDYFERNLPDNYTLTSNREDIHKSCIVRIHHEGNAETKVNDLLKKNVVVSPRDGGIRVAPHYFNTKADIDQLIENL